MQPWKLSGTDTSSSNKSRRSSDVSQRYELEQVRRGVNPVGNTIQPGVGSRRPNRRRSESSNSQATTEEESRDEDSLRDDLSVDSFYNKVTTNIGNVSKFESTIYRMPANTTDLESMLDFSESQLHLHEIGIGMDGDEDESSGLLLDISSLLLEYPMLQSLLGSSCFYTHHMPTLVRRVVAPTLIGVHLFLSFGLLIALQLTGDLEPPVSHAYTVAWLIPLLTFFTMRRYASSQHLLFLLARCNSTKIETREGKKWCKRISYVVNFGTLVMSLAWIIPNIVVIAQGELGRDTEYPVLWWIWTCTRVFDVISIQVMFSGVGLYTLSCQMLITSVNALALTIVREGRAEEQSNTQTHFSDSSMMRQRIAASRNHELRKVRALLRGTSKSLQFYFASMFLICTVTIIFTLYVLLVIVDVLDFENSPMMDVVLSVLLPVAALVLTILLVFQGGKVTKTFENLSKFLQYLNFGNGIQDREFLQNLMQSDNAFKVYGVVVDNQLMARLMWLSLSALLFMLQRRQYELLQKAQ